MAVLTVKEKMALQNLPEGAHIMLTDEEWNYVQTFANRSSLWNREAIYLGDASSSGRRGHGEMEWEMVYEQHKDRIMMNKTHWVKLAQRKWAQDELKQSRIGRLMDRFGLLLSMASSDDISTFPVKLTKQGIQHMVQFFRLYGLRPLWRNPFFHLLVTFKDEEAEKEFDRLADQDPYGHLQRQMQRLHNKTNIRAEISKALARRQNSSDESDHDEGLLAMHSSDSRNAMKQEFLKQTRHLAPTRIQVLRDHRPPLSRVLPPEKEMHEKPETSMGESVMDIMTKLFVNDNIDENDGTRLSVALEQHNQAIKEQHRSRMLSRAKSPHSHDSSDAYVSQDDVLATHQVTTDDLKFLDDHDFHRIMDRERNKYFQEMVQEASTWRDYVSALGVPYSVVEEKALARLGRTRGEAGLLSRFGKHQKVNANSFVSSTGGIDTQDAPNTNFGVADLPDVLDAGSAFSHMIFCRADDAGDPQNLPCWCRDIENNFGKLERHNPKRDMWKRLCAPIYCGAMYVNEDDFGIRDEGFSEFTDWQREVCVDYNALLEDEGVFIVSRNEESFLDDGSGHRFGTTGGRAGRRYHTDLEFDDKELLESWGVMPENSYRSFMRALHREAQLVALDTDGGIGYRVVARSLGGMMQNRILRFMTFVYARNFAIPVTDRDDPNQQQCPNTNSASAMRTARKNVVQLSQSDPDRFSIPLAYATLTMADSLERLACPDVSDEVNTILTRWEYRRDPMLFTAAVKELLRFFECNARSLTAPGIEKGVQCIEQQFMGRSQSMDAPSRLDAFYLAGRKMDIIRALAHMRPEPLPAQTICTDPSACCRFDRNPGCCNAIERGASIASACEVDMVPCVCEIGRGIFVPDEYQWSLPLAEKQLRLMVFVQEALLDMATMISDYATQMSIRTQRLMPCLGVLGDLDFLEGDGSGVNPADADPTRIRDWTTENENGKLVLKDTGEQANKNFRLKLPPPDNIWCRYYLWKARFDMTIVLRYRGLRNNRVYKIIDAGSMAGEMVFGGSIDSRGTRLGVVQEKRWPNYEKYDVQTLGTAYYGLGTFESFSDGEPTDILQRQGFKKDTIELPFTYESPMYDSEDQKNTLMDSDDFFIRQFSQGPTRQCFPIAAEMQRINDDPTNVPPSMYHRPNCTACYFSCVAEYGMDCGDNAYTFETWKTQGLAEFVTECTGVAHNAWTAQSLRSENSPVCRRTNEKHACGPRQPCFPGEACDYIRGRCVPSSTDDSGGQMGYLPLGASVSKRIAVSDVLSAEELNLFEQEHGIGVMIGSQMMRVRDNPNLHAVLETIEVLDIPYDELLQEMDDKVFVWQKTANEAFGEDEVDEMHERWMKFARLMELHQVRKPQTTIQANSWFGWNVDDFPGVSSDTFIQSMYSVTQRNGEIPNCPDPSLTTPNGTNPEGYTPMFQGMQCIYTTIEIRFHNPTLVYKLARLRDYLPENLDDFEIKDPDPIDHDESAADDDGSPTSIVVPESGRMLVKPSLEFAPPECLALSRQTGTPPDGPIPDTIPSLWDLQGHQYEIEGIHSLRTYVARMYGWLNVTALPEKYRTNLGIHGETLRIDGGSNPEFEQCIQGVSALEVPFASDQNKGQQWEQWQDHRCIAMTPHLTSDRSPMRFDWPTMGDYSNETPVWDQLRFLVFDQNTIHQMIMNGWSALPRYYVEENNVQQSAHNYKESAERECVTFPTSTYGVEYDGTPFAYANSYQCCRMLLSNLQCDQFSHWTTGLPGERLMKHIHPNEPCWALGIDSNEVDGNCYQHWPYQFQCTENGDNYPKSGVSPIPWPDWKEETDPDCLQYLDYRGDGGAMHRQQLWASGLPRPLFPFMFEHEPKFRCKRLEKIPFEDRVFVKESCLRWDCWENLMVDEWNLPRYEQTIEHYGNVTGYTDAELTDFGLTSSFDTVTMEMNESLPSRLLFGAIEVNMSNRVPTCMLAEQELVTLPTGEPLMCRETGHVKFVETPMQCATQGYNLIQDQSGNYICEKDCMTGLDYGDVCLNSTTNETVTTPDENDECPENTTLTTVLLTDPYCLEGQDPECKMVDSMESGSIEDMKCVRQDGVIIPPQQFWTCEEGPEFVLIWKFSNEPEACVRDSEYIYTQRNGTTTPWEMQIHCHWIKCILVPIPGDEPDGQKCERMPDDWQPLPTTAMTGKTEDGQQFEIRRSGPEGEVDHPGKCVVPVTEEIVVSTETKVTTDKNAAQAELDKRKKTIVEGLDVIELTRVQTSLETCFKIGCVDDVRRNVREAFLFQGEESVRRFIEFDRRTAQCKNNAFVDAVELNAEDENQELMQGMRCTDRASFPAFCYNLDQAPSWETVECQYNELLERQSEGAFFPFSRC